MELDKAANSEFASAGDGAVAVYGPPASQPAALLRADPSVGGLRTGLLAEPLPAALGPITLSFDDNTISDLWLAITWGAP